MSSLLILDSETPERALATKRATGRTAGQAMAEAFLEINPDLTLTVAEPFFSDHVPESHDLTAHAGMAVAGTSAPWSKEPEKPLSDMFARAFAASIPTFASGSSLLTAAALLGASPSAAPPEEETGFARHLRPFGTHPMMAGRRDGFDVIGLEQGMLFQLPEAAIKTAEGPGNRTRAFAYETGGTDLWGTLYHPQSRLSDAAHWLAQPMIGAGGRKAAATAAALRLIEKDPPSYAALIVQHGIGIDILDRAYHLSELRNWLLTKVIP